MRRVPLVGDLLQEFASAFDVAHFLIRPRQVHLGGHLFARSMSLMEAAREAGVYLDTDNMQVFKGESNKCRDRLFKNCCYSDSAGAGMTNQSLFGTGSRLVYDVLMNADNREFLYQGMQALLFSGGFSGWPEQDRKSVV